MASYTLRINGNAQTVETTDADKPLLYVLRELGLTAAKFVPKMPTNRSSLS